MATDSSHLETQVRKPSRIIGLLCASLAEMIISCNEITEKMF